MTLPTPAATTAASDHQHSAAPRSPGSPVTPSPAPKPSAGLTVGGKLKTALDLMVFGPSDGPMMGVAIGWLEATRVAEYDIRSMRRALLKPHVIRYLREQKQVFRASASAQNISALVRIRDASGNAMAQLGAIKTLEQLDDEQAPGAAPQQRAGMVIVVVREASFPAEGNAERTKPQQIDLQPDEFNNGST